MLLYLFCHLQETNIKVVQNISSGTVKENGPTGSSSWTLSPQLVPLFGEVVEYLGGRALLEEEHHWGRLWAFRVLLCFLFTCVSFQLLVTAAMPASADRLAHHNGLILLKQWAIINLFYKLSWSWHFITTMEKLPIHKIIIIYYFNPRVISRIYYFFSIFYYATNNSNISQPNEKTWKASNKHMPVYFLAVPGRECRAELCLSGALHWHSCLSRNLNWV